MSNQRIDNIKSALDEPGAAGAISKLQLVQAASMHFGIVTDEIATIVAWRASTPLPHAPKSVLGVVTIQGRMLSVLELTTLSGNEVASRNPTLDSERHIVALRGDEQLALAVDALGETVQIADADIEPKAERGLVRGVFWFEDKEINVLSIKELFSSALQGRERRRRRF